MTQSGHEPGSPTIGGSVRTITVILGRLVEAFLFTAIFVGVAYGVGDAYDLSGPVAQMLIPAALLAGLVVFVLLLRSSFRRRR